MTKLLLLFLLNLSIALCSDVVVLDYDNYYNTIKKNDAVLLEFYAPWCGHCKQLAPEYEKVATELKGKAVVAKCDATEDLELAEEFDVSGYPTVLLFTKNNPKKPITHEGERSAASLIKFVTRHLGDAVKTLKTEEEFKKFTDVDEISVVATGSGEFLKKFKKYAEALRTDYNFGHVQGSVPGFDSAKPSMRVFCPETTKIALADKVVRTEMPAKQAAFVAWVREASFPLVTVDSSNEAFQRASDRGIPLFIAFNKPSDEERDSLVKVVTTVAEQFKDKEIQFMTKPGVGEGKLQLENLGYQGGEVLPAWCIVHSTKEKQFCSDGTPPEDADGLSAAMSKFVSQFFAGKLKPAVKSEPAENAGTTDGLTTVIGSTFEADITKNKDKDILIEFYAPWCGHCKSLAPEFAAAAKRLESIDSVVIAKIDATANDFTDKRFKVTGYPTLYFIKARKDGKGKTKTSQYQGPRTAAGIVEYIHAEATNKFELPAEPAAEEEKKEEL